MQFPVLVSLPDGRLINVNQITHVDPLTAERCRVNFAVNYVSGSQNGRWNPGGSGEVSGSTFSTQYGLELNMSTIEFLALINKELALIHAMEKAVHVNQG